MLGKLLTRKIYCKKTIQIHFLFKKKVVNL